MALNDAKLGLKKWLQDVTKLTVIFADQAAPRPSVLPYCTLRVDTVTPLGGQDEMQSALGTGKQRTYGVRDATVLVEIIGPGAYAKLEAAEATLSLPTKRETLWAGYGVSVIDTLSLVNATELLETEFEERAQMELRIYYAIEAEDETGLIEQVEINQEVIDITT